MNDLGVMSWRGGIFGWIFGKLVHEVKAVHRKICLSSVSIFFSMLESSELFVTHLGSLSCSLYSEATLPPLVVRLKSPRGTLML